MQMQGGDILIIHLVYQYVTNAAAVLFLDAPQGGLVSLNINFVSFSLSKQCVISNQALNRHGFRKNIKRCHSCFAAQENNNVYNSRC